MRPTSAVVVLPAVLAMYLPFCTAEVRPTMRPSDAPLASLWKAPRDLRDRDLFNGPWGASRAPDPNGIYTLLERKHTGVNPGMTVRDQRGRKWSVKQAPGDGDGDEGPIEVMLSRVLSALGYHQPPVYFLPSFTMGDDWGTHLEGGGRFRLHDQALKDRGEWSWQQNPFVGMRPYQGLLATLMMFGASDLKNSNNTLYEHRTGDLVESWYVVRDLGTALGTTGRLAPLRGDSEAFERRPFIVGVRGGFVQFDYRGWHQELVRNTITPDDVAWASGLLSQLTDRQWRDAFRAGGHPPAVADRFIRKLQASVADGVRIGDGEWRTTR
jgi:hypothetical protein